MFAAGTVRYSWQPIRRTMNARESATVDRDHLKSEIHLMDGGKAMQHDILNTEVTTIDGQKTTLADYAGKVLLIVNVASKCGLTPQYGQLETLQKDLENDGFTVLGFPCNQFLGRSRVAKKRLKPSAAPPTASLSRCSAKLMSMASTVIRSISSWSMPRRRP